MNETVIETQQLSKEFVRDDFHVVALKDVDLTVHRGEFVALMGPSGSGKSTLLHLIAAMDRPTDGKIFVLGQDLRSLSDREMAHWRNQHIGFIFQSFNLIPVMTALENVELPLKLTNLKKRERSGGQEQPVAIARAILTHPELILADEPTGHLDATSAQEALTLLEKLNRDYNKPIIMVTHDPNAASFATKVRHLDKGNLLPEERDSFQTSAKRG